MGYDIFMEYSPNLFDSTKSWRPDIGLKFAAIFTFRIVRCECVYRRMRQNYNLVVKR